jgi:alanyl-tRNA synthetase
MPRAAARSATPASCATPRSRVIVEDTVKVQAAVHGHQGRIVEGEVELGDVFVARVDAEQRARTVRNHSATHLMHKALREVLGGHVQQKGSLVNAERTRFDFAHNAPVTDAQIAQVEALVNAEILANAATRRACCRSTKRRSSAR